MDFIEQIPDFNGFTTILVVIGYKSKQTILITIYNTIASEELAHYLSFMFSPNMAYLTISPPTVALNLSPNSHVPLPKP